MDFEEKHSNHGLFSLWKRYFFINLLAYKWVAMTIPQTWLSYRQCCGFNLA
jgi:hypothetical protein